MANVSKVMNLKRIMSQTGLKTINNQTTNLHTRCQKANGISYQLAPLLQHPKIQMDTRAKLINTILGPD